MATRFLRKAHEGAPVLIWTEILAGHKGMVECEADGTVIGEAVPEDEPAAKSEVFEDVPVVKVVPVEEPALDFASETPEAPPVEAAEVQEQEPEVGVQEAADAVQERSERVLEIQAMLTQLSGPEIRQRVKDDFEGKTLPIGISKLALIEHYIELDRAKAAQGAG
jgi:hypothetical protein